VPGRAGHFQEAFRIQVEYFQSQLRTAAEEATQIGAWIVGLANSPMHFLVSRHPPNLAFGKGHASGHF
jgi:hypothetical protein